MIAVDTNILVYAHRAESPWHEAAQRCLARAALTRWAIPWPCVHEFLAVVTHARIFNPPTPMQDALKAVEGWLESPTLRLLSEFDGYAPILTSLLQRGNVTGPRVHDARVAALCMEHGVEELWTVDRDFSRFPNLQARNPLDD